MMKASSPDNAAIVTCKCYGLVFTEFIGTQAFVTRVTCHVFESSNLPEKPNQSNECAGNISMPKPFSGDVAGNSCPD